MNSFVKVLAHKLFALSVLIGIGAWFLVLPAFTGHLGANPLDKLLHQSGEIAIWTLGSVLALTPLRVLFPHLRIVTALNRHRRAIGVTACIYGLLHFSFHVLYEGGLVGLVRSFSKPFIWFGAGGLTILVILAVTSNQLSIRTLGAKNWKRLHRLVYVAAAVLIYHQAIAGKGHLATARWLLFSLASLQLARLTKTLVWKKRPATSSPTAAQQVPLGPGPTGLGKSSHQSPESVLDRCQRSPRRRLPADENRRYFHPA
ncbi:MAG TPA: ferric reductase-like transmembrane domain-containing protein [Candidatus Udaeobacter sp.]